MADRHRIAMKRVVVTGNAGGGKTTLSKRLSRATGCRSSFSIRFYGGRVGRHCRQPTSMQYIVS